MWYRTEFFDANGQTVDLLLAQNYEDILEYADKIADSYEIAKITTIDTKKENNNVL